MNKFTFIFSLLMMLYMQSIIAQDIFPRTYSGYKDAALSGVQDNNKNLYVVGCNGSAQTTVISGQESGFLKNSGVFVTKLDNVSHLKAGIYWMQIKLKSGKVIQKQFIIK